MAATLSPVLMGRKRASLEEVNVLHDRMLHLVELDKKLDMEMIKVVSHRANWDQFWQSQYDELIEQLEKNNLELFEDEDSEEQYSSEEDIDDLVMDETGSFKKPRRLRASMMKKLNLLDKEQTIRSRRIEYFEMFLNVESRRNEILNQQAELSAQIKDLLKAELNSEEVLDPKQEPKRRAMISALARWWDCLLYNTSEELNERMQDEEVGKWSELYLKWRMWIDLKAGVFHDNEDGVQANYMAS